MLPNQFAVRATGSCTLVACLPAVRFVTAVNSAGTPTAGVQLFPGGGSWSSLSDRASKENLAPVDGRRVLERLAEVPISTWNWIAQPGYRHIGPMAQDFRAAFGVGESDASITSVDADGVALAAIQGLWVELQQERARNDALEARLAALEARLAGQGSG